ncbi:hypothetical protein Tco_0005619 [Tanacetum coccineum]
MGGLSSQPRTDLALSPNNAFPVEELYTPEFLDSLQENTSFWQAPNPHEYLVEQVAISPTKKKGCIAYRKKVVTIESKCCTHSRFSGNKTKLRWLKNLKVKGTDVLSYNQHFQELALMCSRMFPKESDEVEKYVGGLPDMIRGSVMDSKLKTMQDAIEFATKLID